MDVGPPVPHFAGPSLEIVNHDQVVYFSRVEKDGGEKDPEGLYRPHLLTKDLSHEVLDSTEQ